MTTAVETGHGSTFSLANASATLVELGEVIDIPLPNGTTELIPASHMKTVGFKDYITAPLKEGEEASITMNWIPGSTTDTLCQEAKGKTRNFKIVIPVGNGGRQFTGSVLVRDYNRSNPSEDKRTATLVVKWVSEITEAAVTP